MARESGDPIDSTGNKRSGGFCGGNGYGGLKSKGGGRFGGEVGSKTNKAEGKKEGALTSSTSGPPGARIRRRPTLPHSLPCSTIGAEELNFRVRNGNGWNLFAMTTENLG